MAPIAPTPLTAEPTPRLGRLRTLTVILILIAAVAVIVAGAYGYYRYYHRPASSPQALNTRISFDPDDLDGTIAQMDAILLKDPTDAPALVIKSFALSQKGSLGFEEVQYGSQAAVLAQQAISIDASSSEAYRALGYADEIQQKYSDAHTAYQKALTLDPKNSAALFDDAHAYDLQGDSDKAAVGYAAALAADPNNYAADMGLGRIANAKGDIDGALADFGKVYADSPSSHDTAQSAYSIGMLLMQEKNADLARGYLDQATKSDPSYPSGWYGLGTVLYVQAMGTTTIDDAQRANLLLGSVDDLNTAVKLNPNQSIAYLQLAEDEYVLGNLDIALETLDQAATTTPNDITLSASEKTSTLQSIAAFKAFISKGYPPSKK